MKSVKIREVRNKITESLVVEKDKKIEKIADLFLESQINRTIYVINKKKEMIGYITLKKLLKRLLLEVLGTEFYTKNGSENFYSLSKFASATTAENIMETDYIGIEDEDELDSAVKIMYKYDLQELPVVNGKKEIIGDLNILEIVLGWKKLKEDE